ncbi:MAG: hypothetical protein DME16_16945 [Candidatus Rokuibacteriota bacterium]|nr:MAG: hypothetical protein DME16_16945 [Candidatus Rokubacteria bacterium]
MTSRPPTRALHVLDHSLPIGSGYSYRSRSIVTFQKRLGLDPVVLTSPKQGTNTDGREQVDGITHYRTGQTGGRLPFARELLLMARMAARIIRVARAEGVDLIHAHSPSLNVVLRRAHRVVAICEGIRSEIISRGIPPERVALVPNGVDPEWLEPRTRATEIANHLGLGDGPVFGYIGSFSRYEGLAFLIDAMPELLGRFPNAKLLLVGGGRDEEAVRKAAGNIGAAVLVPGRVPQEDVRDFYTVVDVFVLPRRRIRLTELVTPLKPLEAMAMGLPVLASDIGGHAEIVNNGQTGLLFKTESSKSLVEQARRLGEDRDLRAQLGAGGRQWVEAERTWERIVARYLPIYGGVA